MSNRSPNFNTPQFATDLLNLRHKHKLDRLSVRRAYNRALTGRATNEVEIGMDVLTTKFLQDMMTCGDRFRDVIIEFVGSICSRLDAAISNAA